MTDINTKSTYLSPQQAGLILLEKFNLPEHTRSFTLRVTPNEAVAVIEHDVLQETMETITTEFDLVKRS